MEDEKARRFYLICNYEKPSCLARLCLLLFIFYPKTHIFPSVSCEFSRFLYEGEKEFLFQNCVEYTLWHKFFACNRKFTFYPLLFHKRSVHYFQSKDID